MTNETKHTPTPWKVVEDDEIREGIRKKYETLRIVGSSEVVCGGDGICTVDSMNDRSFAEDAANMRHIVKCVNMHDELVEALSELMKVYSEPDTEICCNGYHCGCQGASVRQQAEYYARETLKKAGAL